MRDDDGRRLFSPNPALRSIITDGRHVHYPEPPALNYSEHQGAEPFSLRASVSVLAFASTDVTNVFHCDRQVLARPVYPADMPAGSAADCLAAMRLMKFCSDFFPACFRVTRLKDPHVSAPLGGQTLVPTHNGNGSFHIHNNTALRFT